jgi:cytoskeletal protein CcmA (bactofilin family)
MFNNKSKSEDSESAIPSSSASLISSGTSMKGDITSSGDLRIDGTLVGNIICSAKVIIGANGVVEGDVSGQLADIMGKVNGTIKVKELLQLKSNCQVNGNLYSAKLQIEPAATFNGQCHMTQEEPKGLSGKTNSEPRKDGFQKAPSLAIS